MLMYICCKDIMDIRCQKSLDDFIASEVKKGGGKCRGFSEGAIKLLKARGLVI